MKPAEGRRRVVIESVTPQVDGGRYAVKRVVGDVVRVTAAIYGDGHDHVAARLLFRRAKSKAWSSAEFVPLNNDLWEAKFPVDAIGHWQYTVKAWVDHFGTWEADLRKRLDAQPSAPADTLDDAGQLQAGAKPVMGDIPLAFESGALLLMAAAGRAAGKDAEALKKAATALQQAAKKSGVRFEYPFTADVVALALQYPDLAFATTYALELPLWVDRVRARYSSWYEIFPRSLATTEDGHGTLKDVQNFLPSVVEQGFDVLYLPPIHPIGTAYRKGRNNNVKAEAGDVGSPWAIGNVDGGHKAVHADLGTLADFDALIVAMKGHGLELAMDIAFQCSPDHPWVKEHPEWFSIRPDGTIQYAENPPKKYQDIYPLNFESKDWTGLWQELYSVFVFWAKRGVRIFRVDNPHTKALPFWEWCIDEIRKKYPDAIFLAEAFTRPHVMYGLAKMGYTQSYTYFSWRNSKAELEEYMEEITTAPVSDFFRPNLWPNTPDILPEALQNGGRPVIMQRAILAATLGASYGIYGPAFELGEHLPMKPGGEEYLSSEKYEIRRWNRDAPESVAPLLRTLNSIRREHAAFQTNETLRFHPIDNDQLTCYSKTSKSGDVVLVVVNLDGQGVQTGWTNLDLSALGLADNQAYEVEDLLSGDRYQWRGVRNYVLLDPTRWPAHVFAVHAGPIEP